METIIDLLNLSTLNNKSHIYIEYNKTFITWKNVALHDGKILNYISDNHLLALPKIMKPLLNLVTWGDLR